MNLFISSAFAQGAAAAEPSGGLQAQLLQFAPIALVLVVFYFIYFRPQQQKARDAKAMASALKRGDRVLTSGGILATISRIKDGADELEVEIAPNVRVTVLRHTVSTLAKPKAAEPAPVAKAS